MAGLAVELLSLRLLPLCAIYPMNASCLVFLYYWKESKLRKARSSSFKELHVCFAVLISWSLPFVAGSPDGSSPRVMRLSELFDAMLGSQSCIYVAGLLVAGMAAHF